MTKQVPYPRCTKPLWLRLPVMGSLEDGPMSQQVLASRPFLQSLLWGLALITLQAGYTDPFLKLSLRSVVNCSLSDPSLEPVYLNWPYQGQTAPDSIAPRVLRATQNPFRCVLITTFTVDKLHSVRLNVKNVSDFFPPQIRSDDVQCLFKLK